MTSGMYRRSPTGISTGHSLMTREPVYNTANVEKMTLLKVIIVSKVNTARSVYGELVHCPHNANSAWRACRRGRRSSSSRARLAIFNLIRIYTYPTPLSWILRKCEKKPCSEVTKFLYAMYDHSEGLPPGK